MGEALAECLLADLVGVYWPWNPERDKRTPRASLPGADLIGFVHVDGETHLLLGEVKTSSDPHTPPSAMNGRSGMIHQLDRLATTPEIHRSLLYWLHARCKGAASEPLFREAAAHYLRSQGRRLELHGVLLRDTPPAEADLAARGKTLAGLVGAPTSVVLQAWYLPRAIADLPCLVEGPPP